MSGIFVLLAPLILAATWMALIAPNIARLFGVPLAIGFWRLDRKNEHLSRSQYMWAFGAFSFGVGLFLYLTVSRLLWWLMMGDVSSHRSSSEVLFLLIFSVGLGTLFGAISAPRTKEKI